MRNGENTLREFARDFVKGVTFNAIKNGDMKPNSMVTQWKRAKQQYSLYTRGKKEILKKKGKKKFSLNYSNSSKKKKKKNFFFLNFSKYNEVKESIKALFNLDYVENNYIYSYVKSFKRTPPITKLYLISTFLLSVLIHINKNVYKLILYDFHKIFKKGEIWRLLTPYLYIGNLYLQYILMFNYLNIYMSSVEIAHYKNPEDFLIFLTYGYMLNILFTIVGSMYNENVMEIKKHIHNIGNLIMKKCKNKEQKIDIKKEHYNHLGYVFSTYILYYWSRINEGTLINCFELFLIKADFCVCTRCMTCTGRSTSRSAVTLARRMHRGVSSVQRVAIGAKQDNTETKHDGGETFSKLSKTHAEEKQRSFIF
ncbi:DER1-like protein, putative [Plasmodium ovale curtisi]|uniref:Derlin n=1 Tax=Plasmodium ovale curtisi TaxID=864141 RepID=A0A1A8W929_PLAOA|nr:DER1-like protein, putative [Plasmodium ovale curtisi]